MLSLAQQKFLTALQVKKYRQKYRKFAVEGSKLVLELLSQTRVPVTAIYGLERWALENASALAPFNQIFTPVTETELKKISALTTPNAVLAVAEAPPGPPIMGGETLRSNSPLNNGAAPLPPLWGGRGGLSFYLDGIRDPGNLGTILRIADWFGFAAVFCSPDCADAYSPKVVQASMGAIFRVPVPEIGIDELLAGQPAWPVMGAVLDGEDLFESDLPAGGLLVIGNEGSGISPAVEARLTHRLTIPRGPDSAAESLNASVAAGILAAFLTAQRGRSPKK